MFALCFFVYVLLFFTLSVPCMPVLQVESCVCTLFFVYVCVFFFTLSVPCMPVLQVECCFCTLFYFILFFYLVLFPVCLFCRQSVAFAPWFLCVCFFTLFVPRMLVLQVECCFCTCFGVVVFLPCLFPIIPLVGLVCVTLQQLLRVVALAPLAPSYLHAYHALVFTSCEIAPLCAGSKPSSRLSSSNRPFHRPSQTIPMTINRLCVCQRVYVCMNGMR